MGKKQRQVTTVFRGQAQTREDWLAQEWPLTLVVNGFEYITLLTTPSDLEELAVGFALGEGLLSSQTDILSLNIESTPRGGKARLELKDVVDFAQRLVATRRSTTGCGKGSTLWRVPQPTPVTGGRKISANQVVELMKQFAAGVQLFASTGAVHGAALAADELLLIREDVARHNAVDKLAGNVVFQNTDTSSLCLLLSGRVSSELVNKAAWMGVGIILSRGAPTDLAVELAEKLGVSLLGFIRGQRFNIYSHGQRIQL